MTDGQSAAHQASASERQDESVDSFLPVPGMSTDITMDRATVERSLITLVLTIVELLRQLMERQAIRGSTRETWRTSRSSKLDQR